MNGDTLFGIAFLLAAIPAALYTWNAFLFRRTPHFIPIVPPRISVLIPARNEERVIAACIDSVLASVGVELEVIVLDDDSEDRTAEIIQQLAEKESRVRWEPAAPLPAGWCGKQHACFELSKLAQSPVIAFLDADVRLSPDALVRLAAFLQQSRAGLISGFPRQETGTLLEKLLIPLIHWLLLSYLPLWGMRNSRWAAFGAGCGQLFITTRDAYQCAGGHRAIKNSRHDGIALPRAYRRAGLRTDICDATDIASCRMYHSAGGVWNGLAKNAHEGMGSEKAISIWTLLLLGGCVMPLGILPRLHGACRFRQSWFGAVLHPVGIMLLIAIQWYALVRKRIGRPVGWKGRLSMTPRLSSRDFAATHTSSSSTIA